MISTAKTRVLVVDLNNFARYPTLSVGYLVSISRRAGLAVQVLSPLAAGIRGVAREPRATRRHLIRERINFASAQSSSRIVRSLRSWFGERTRSPLSRQTAVVARTFEEELERFAPDVVLVSTYLMYRQLVETLCGIARRRRVPVLVGGPYFAQPEVLREWVGIEGLSALVAGEVELELPRVVEALLEGGDPTKIDGVVMSDGMGGLRGSIAAPLATLDQVPMPDFSDFPWERYPQRIVPVLTGRGCGWGRCTFCSDITSTAGRTFRSRSPGNVLREVRHHHEMLGADLFVFTDLKLNSDLSMWHRLIEGMQDAAPGSRWIASVHVSGRGDHGLGKGELEAAAASGCVRLTSGLESGSQRVLDRMRKGTRLERFSEFVRSADDVGISVRCTMIAGYPGEEVQDVRASTTFVKRHEDAIERIKLCNFSVIVGTEIHRSLVEERTKSGTALHPKPGSAWVDFHEPRENERAYQRAIAQLVTAVHRVNEKPLRDRALVFEGVM
ncbi:MAG TPA: radical SAM protein [Planctomycetota bacterium]|nr:radical SAM protein [Planctomycetota bacterium]